MTKKYLLLTAFLPLAFIGCKANRQYAELPEVRPWGKDIPVFKAKFKKEKVEEIKIPVEPEGELTLAQTLRLVLMKNSQLAAYSWEIRAREAAAMQAGLRPNPELGFEVENIAGSGANTGTDNAESTLALSQLLETAGKRFKRLKAAKLDSDLAGWDYEAMRLATLSAATKAYINLLTAQKQLELAKEIYQISKKVYSIAEARVKAGKVSPLEKTKATVALARGHINLKSAESYLKKLKVTLSAFWGTDKPVFTKLTGNLNKISKIPAAEKLAHFIGENPDIARWMVELEQKNAVLALEKSRRIPNVTLSGGVRRFEETNDNAFVVAISFDLPLFDRNQGGILEAESRLLKAEKEKDAAIINIRKNLAETYQSLSFASIEVKALKEDVLPSAQKAYEAASSGYKNGKFNYLDVLDAQRTLFEVKEQYLQALGEYHNSKTDIEQLIGLSLDKVLTMKKLEK